MKKTLPRIKKFVHRSCHNSTYGQVANKRIKLDIQRLPEPFEELYSLRSHLTPVRRYSASCFKSFSSLISPHNSFSFVINSKHTIYIFTRFKGPVRAEKVALFVDIRKIDENGAFFVFTVNSKSLTALR
jgi:hypothetical protein